MKSLLHFVFCERSGPKDLCVATIAFPLLVAGSFAMEEKKE
ncbi:MAG: hypothetical protein V2A62_02650 [Candidatus Woesearchaeota archaeon]